MFSTLLIEVLYSSSTSPDTNPMSGEPKHIFNIKERTNIKSCSNARSCIKISSFVYINISCSDFRNLIALNICDLPCDSPNANFDFQKLVLPSADVSARSMCTPRFFRQLNVLLHLIQSCLTA